MKCVCFCNKIEFANFNFKNITERYCALIYVEEIVKATQLVKEQGDVKSQETLNLCKSFLENTDNASLTKSQNNAIDQLFETPKFHVKNSKKLSLEGSMSCKY